MSIILGIDTAMTGSSVAITRNNEVIASITCTEKGVQASQLLLHIEDCLKQASLSYHNINKIAVCIGPGGFTGIRVGLAAARGIALSAEKPIVGFSSLEVMLYGASANSIAILNAGRGQYYIQHSDTEDIITIEEAALEQSLENENKIISDAQLDIEQKVTIHNPQDNASILCRLAQSHKGRAPEPLYVRAPDAKIQKKLLS